MADDIPIEQAPPPQGMFGRVNQGMNNFFGPINRGMESVVGKPDPIRNLMMAISAMQPGRSAMPMGFRNRIPSPPLTREQPTIGNQPMGLPNSAELAAQAAQSRANPYGVYESTRRADATNPSRFRANTFNPSTEMSMMPFDATRGTRVMTPANMTADQRYNMSVMQQLLRGGQ